MSEAVAQLYESLHVLHKAPNLVLLLNLIDQQTDLNAQFEAENRAFNYAQQASIAVCMVEYNKSAVDLSNGQVCAMTKSPVRSLTGLFCSFGTIYFEVDDGDS
ncbi:hypothetical protein D3C81_798400 [compost metagenome]